MYKTQNLKIYYDQKFEDSFNQQLINYNNAYQHAIGIMYNDMILVEQYLRNSGVSNSLLGFHTTSNMMGKYELHKILTTYRKQHPSNTHAWTQRNAMEHARQAVISFAESNGIKRNSKKSLARDGKTPRASNPLKLLKQQFTIGSSRDIPKLKKGKLYIPGIGNVILDQKLPPDIKSWTITKTGNHYLRLNVSCKIPDSPIKTEGFYVALDYGLANIITALFYTGDGKKAASIFLNPPENATRSKNDQISGLISKRSNCKCGSRKYGFYTKKIKKLLKKLGNRRTEWEILVGRQISAIAKQVAVENLSVKKMMKKKHGAIGKRDLNRKFVYGRISKNQAMVCWHCQKIGAPVLKIDPRDTSRRCYSCGHISEYSRVKQAIFDCIKCQYEEHADVNACCNIARKAGMPALCTNVVKCEGWGDLFRHLDIDPLAHGILFEHSNHSGFAKKCESG